MDTKTEHMVAKQLEDGTLVPMYWTAADDDRAHEGVKSLADEFNEDEARLGKTTAKGAPSNYVVLKATTTYEVL